MSDDLTLHVLQEAINGDRRLNDERSRLSSDAVRLAADQQKAHFAALNESRLLIETILKTLASKTEVDQRLSALTEKIDSLANRIDRMEGSMVGRGALFSLIATVLLVTFAAIGIILRIK